MIFYGEPEGEFLDNGNFLFDKDFSFIDQDRFTWMVYAGFESNGASIPRCAWSIVGGPFDDPAIRKAAFLHDMAYAMDGASRIGKIANRKECDYMFYEAMICAGCNSFKARLLWSFVRCFGWKFWKGK